MSEQLAERLRNKLGVSDPKILQLLVFGIEDAKGYWEKVGEIADPGVGVKDIRATLESMRGALRKMARGTVTSAATRQLEIAAKMLPRLHMRVLGQYGGDPIDAELTLAAMLESPSAVAAQRLLACVDGLLGDLVSPGRGNSRRQAKTYAMGIDKLAQWFGETLPRHAVSANPQSKFYAYCECFLEHVGHQGDASRHIEKALEIRSGWVKVPL